MVNQRLKLISVIILSLLLAYTAYWYLQNNHQKSTPHDDEVHVHADIMVYIEDERVRFTADQYQSSSNQILHESFHFHDSNDEIIHRHAAGLTLTEFLKSLNVILNEDCIILDNGSEYCTEDDRSLQLYVNGEIDKNITSYIPQDEDRILVYYGDPNSSNLPEYLNNITDRACIFSGTCPERGVPPPESCGLTCEL